MRPKVFVSTSSLGPYGFRREDEVLTEHSSPDIGPLSRDALELEACALEAEALGTRVVFRGEVLDRARDRAGTEHELTEQDLKRALQLIVEHEQEIRDAGTCHFGS